MVLKADWQAGDPYTADDANDVADEVNGLASAVASGLSGKADKSTAITAGTGLTGGGDLSANRTLAVAFGSSGSTACAGNDARLADQRTPGDNTVTTAKLQNNAVTTGKIQDAAVTVAKLGADVGPAIQGLIDASTAALVSGAANGTPSGFVADLLNETQWAGVGSPTSGKVYLVFED